jgi:prefoldin subunit 5
VGECKHVRRCRIEFGQVDTERLQNQVTATANELEVDAERLESKAQELTETATELRNALDRLEEVSR